YLGSRLGPTAPIASLKSDVRKHTPLFAAHAPRRLFRGRSCSARARRRFRLRWFRRRDTSEEQAPIEAAAPAETPEPVVTAEPAADEAAGQPTTTKPRRRRGSRGGRGRSRKTATAEPKSEQADTVEEK